jgi:hypothetical protein
MDTALFPGGNSIASTSSSASMMEQPLVLFTYLLRKERLCGFHKHRTGEKRFIRPLNCGEREHMPLIADIALRAYTTLPRNPGFCLFAYSMPSKFVGFMCPNDFSANRASF